MRSRLLLFLSIVVIGFASCTNNQKKFTVVGHLTNIPKQNVFLEELNINEITIIDSAKVDDKGNFEVSGTTPEPGLYRLRFEQNQFILLSLYKGTVKVEGDWNKLDAYTVSGSESSDGLRQFLVTVREHLKDFNTMSVVLDTLQAKGNDSLLKEAKKDLQNMNEQFTRYIEVYSDTTKYFPNALFAVQMLNPSVEKDYLQVFAQTLPKRFPNSVFAKDYATKVTQMFATPEQAHTTGIQIGATAPEIKLPDINGKDVSLSSFKGKYVLVDFWASWCGPCRGENPNVVAAYNKYKDKNFTVLGVSLDTDKDKWQTAVNKDHLTWTHISDLKGWESIAARDYSVESIPSNFLIDPNGKVIARDLRGEELMKELANILK